MTRIYTIYGLRLTSRDPIIDSRTQEVIDDGTNHEITLGSFSDKDVANSFADNIRKTVLKKVWKIYIK